MFSNQEDARILDLFKELVLVSCGFKMETGREQSLLDGLSKRMSARGINRAESYHALLIRDKEELKNLIELLTVNETYFFREPEYLTLMADRLIQELMAGTSHRPIKILSAGCSTGEEPYSIAIMLKERFGAESERLFTITGVDIDSTVIDDAKKGIYGKSSFRGMDCDIQERYFKPAGPEKLQVVDEIRKQVGFEVVNLLDSSYPQRMQMPDIIFYRNVSIYFPGQVQREIFSRLAELLNHGGCLVVGAAETFHHNIGVLSLVEQDSLFFYRKTGKPAMMIEERRKSVRNPVLNKIPKHLPGSRLAVTAGKADSAVAGKGKKPTDIQYKQQPQVAGADIRERFDKALQLSRDGLLSEALDILDELIYQDEGFIKAHTLKGSLLLNLSRFDEVGSICVHVISRDPLCLEAYLMLGIVARQQGDEDTAFRRFREAIYINGSCWLAHFYTAEIQFSRKDPDRARKSYETTLKILASGSLKEHGQSFFPLSVNAEQFAVICRHKLSLLKEK